jgi:hypothetical protein
MQTDPALRYTVYDPFWEAMYCRKTFNEAAQVADHIGCGLIIGVAADAVLGAPLCRYRKTGETWQVEVLQKKTSQTRCFD